MLRAAAAKIVLRRLPRPQHTLGAVGGERPLRVSLTDLLATVRLCIVDILDKRYGVLLRQLHHLILLLLLLLLQDKAAAVHAAVL